MDVFPLLFEIKPFSLCTTDEVYIPCSGLKPAPQLPVNGNVFIFDQFLCEPVADHLFPTPLPCLMSFSERAKT